MTKALEEARQEAGQQRQAVADVSSGMRQQITDLEEQVAKASQGSSKRLDELQTENDKLEDIFTGQKRSHVGTVTDNIQVPVIEKGSAVITFVQGNEVNAMDNKTYETLILPLDPEMNLEAGGEIQWMEAMGRYRITRDH